MSGVTVRLPSLHELGVVGDRFFDRDVRERGRYVLENGWTVEVLDMKSWFAMTTTAERRAA